MFWQTKRKKNARTDRRKKLLRVESLEQRRLLAVNIYIDAGVLSLAGDNSGNDVVIAPSTVGAAADTYTITGANGTQLFVATGPGAPGTPGLTEVAVQSPYTTSSSSPAYSLAINLGQGTSPNNLLVGSSTATSTFNPVGGVTIQDNTNDVNQLGYVQLSSLTIENATLPAASPTNNVTNTLTCVNVTGPVIIDNGGGISSTTITNNPNSPNLTPLPIAANPQSLLSGGLTVDGPSSSASSPSASQTLNIIGTKITGATSIYDMGFGVAPTMGSTATSIVGSTLDGTLFIENGTTGSGNNSSNDVTIGSGTSTIPTTLGVASPVAGTTEVTIINGAGGSYTQFTGDSATIPLSVNGGVTVENGTAASASNVVSFTYADVAQAVSVNNIGGTLAGPDFLSKVLVMNSVLGEQASSPVTISNSVGYDSFTMTTSTAPWGVSLNNIAGALTPYAAFGSQTSISGSTIGADLSTISPSLTLDGDNGADAVTVSSSTINGVTTLNLNGGSNGGNPLAPGATPGVYFSKATLTALNISSGLAASAAFPGAASPGYDAVEISGGSIASALNLNMGGVNNVITITGVTLPPEGLGSVLIACNLANAADSNVLNIDTALYKSIAENYPTNGIGPDITENLD